MITIEEKRTTKLPGIASIYISFDYNKDIVEAIKTNTCIRDFNNKTLTWEVPVTDLSKLLDSLSTLDDIKLKMLDNLQTCNRDKVTHGKYKTNPYKHQLEAIEYGMTHDKWLLLDAPGLGKTLAATCIAQNLKEQRGIEHCLIICGVNALKHNWKKEIQRHSDLSCTILGEKKNKRGNIVIGGIQERVKQLSNIVEEFAVITNIETLRDSDIIKAINNGPNKFDLVIVDEVHRMKNPSSEQGKNFLKLKNAKYKIAMTGTLLLNNPVDAYVPLKWIGVDNSSFTNFKYYYCNYGGNFGNELLGYRNLDVLKSQLSTCSLRRTKELLDLPPKNIIVEDVEMNDTQTKFYNDIVSHIFNDVDIVDMSTSTVLSLTSRLRQATECPSMLTTSNIVSEKLLRAADLAEQLVSNGEKVIIFSVFKRTLDDLYKLLEKYNPLVCTGDIHDDIIERNKELFQNNPSYPIMLCTTQKMGTGHTLTAASHAIFVSHPWTQADCEQCEDRIHRIGSIEPVFIHYLVCTNTIDEHVRELVNDKGAISDYIVDDKITQNSVDSLRKYISELQHNIF